MVQFAAYLIGEDGHIIDRFDLLCADGSDARMRASNLAIHHDVELWEGARRMKTYPAQSARIEGKNT